MWTCSIFHVRCVQSYFSIIENDWQEKIVLSLYLDKIFHFLLCSFISHFFSSELKLFPFWYIPDFSINSTERFYPDTDWIYFQLKLFHTDINSFSNWSLNLNLACFHSVLVLKILLFSVSCNLDISFHSQTKLNSLSETFYSCDLLGISDILQALFPH